MENKPKKPNNKTKKRPQNIVDQLTEIKPIVIRKKKPVLNIIEDALESVQKVNPVRATEPVDSPQPALSKCPPGTRRNKDNEICESTNNATRKYRKNDYNVFPVADRETESYKYEDMPLQVLRLIWAKRINRDIKDKNAKFSTYPFTNASLLVTELRRMDREKATVGLSHPMNMIEKTIDSTATPGLETPLKALETAEQKINSMASLVPNDETLKSIEIESGSQPPKPLGEADAINEDDVVDETIADADVTYPTDDIQIIESQDVPLDSDAIENAKLDEIVAANDDVSDDEVDDIHDSIDANVRLLHRESTEHKDAELYAFLYPNLNDPNFNIKIAKRKEFQDTQYDGTIHDIKKQAEILCHQDFEIAPHQQFIKNFLSQQTPYNGLLLYHGLGTGKTCSAIGVAEEMRSYLNQIGIKQKIFVVASPNVQANFRMQLFNPEKLMEKDGQWVLNTCIGRALLDEINPTHLRGIPKERVISEINAIINANYRFMGYIELANFITKYTGVPEESGFSHEKRRAMEIKKIRAVFNNRLLIVDEVHNIRNTDDNGDKKRTAILLMNVAKYSDNMRLLLLSATPMYNSYKEIIWLTNLLNLNDKRGKIKAEDVFDANGDFLQGTTSADGKEGKEGGRELLQRKLIGYISYVRGENPYTFPYRIYPADFAAENALASITYPAKQMNLNAIEKPIQYIPLFVTPVGGYQARAYQFIMEYMRKKSYNVTTKEGAERNMPSFENMERFGYTLLRRPIQALNIVYPSAELEQMIQPTADVPVATEVPPAPTEAELMEKEQEEVPSQEGSQEAPIEQPVVEQPVEEPVVEQPAVEPVEQQKDVQPLEKMAGGADEPTIPFDAEKQNEVIRRILGEPGLSRIVSSKKTETPHPLRHQFEYKEDVTKTYGAIFSPTEIGKYSGKIAAICNSIKASKGIVLVYSEYIDGGLVPLALALEEMGFARFGTAGHTRSLFKTPRTEAVDSVTFEAKSAYTGAKFQQAKYLMITGDKHFSPNNAADLNYLTKKDNKNGELVKVVLISRAGTEGLDFKNIRQVHVMEPWYNMNRIEQIIGRGVRNFSHCGLPFEERNVQIFLHGSQPAGDEEPADLYVYRSAEMKTTQIGRVTRLLKEVAVDCLLNIGQTNFTAEKLATLAENQTIELELSNGKKIPYKIGDKPFTEQCDYMDNCNFTCSPTAEIKPEDIVKDTYTEDYLRTNYDNISRRIRELFREKTALGYYEKEPLIRAINIVKEYPREHIFFVLSQFVENQEEYLFDKYGRRGNLINKEDIYAFQPEEITDQNASIYERVTPIDYKRPSYEMEIAKRTPEGTEEVVIEKHQAEAPESDTNKEGLVEGTEKTTVVDDSSTKVYNMIIEELTEIQKTVLKTDNTIPASETNWYKHASLVINTIHKIHKIPLDKIMEYVIHHYLDTLSFEKKFALVKEIFSPEYEPKIQLENLVAKYYRDRVLEIKNARGAVSVRGMILAKEETWDLYVQQTETSGHWARRKESDYDRFKGQIMNKYVVSHAKIPSLVGIIHSFRHRGLVFKTRNMLLKRASSGAYCHQSGKVDTIKDINTILGEQVYFENNTRFIFNIGLCIILEILLRHFTTTNMGGKVHFFDAEKTLVNQIVRCKVTPAGDLKCLD